MRTVAPVVGDLAIGLTDGEVGARRLWVIHLAHALWARHPDLQILRESQGVDATKMPEGYLLPEFVHMVPRGYDDLMWFQLRAGITKVATEGYSTAYPEHAASSYRKFCALRDEKIIPAGLRFQVCIPFPDDAVRLFTNDAHDMDKIVEAYIDIVRNDVRSICDSILHDDLLLQWDINWETVAIEHGDHMPDAAPMQFKPNGDPWSRFLRYVRELNSAVPETVPLGMHLCYGELHHKHFREPADLRASVDMANQATKVSPRKIDYFHMAVPRHRTDDAYFEPMAELDIETATIYAGLVHYTDGVDGSLQRLDTLRRHYTGPLGVSTECGLGSRPLDQDLVSLLRIHREVANHV